MSRLQSTHFKFHIQKGYTFIELLVVIAIIGIIATISIASFVTYNDAQVAQTSTQNVTDMYTVARSKATSLIKPAVCNNAVLNGYQVLIKQGTTYELDVVCGSTAFALSTKNLPNGMTFVSNSTPKVFFNVITAYVSNGGKITLTGKGKSKVITIDSYGNISVQ